MPASRARRAHRPKRPLWRCPRCGKLFVTRNVYHSCARYSMAHHFAGRPKAKALFAHFRRVVEAFGPVRIVSNQTRIGFMDRVRFAGCWVRRDSLRVSFWLKRLVRSNRFARIEQAAPRAWVYTFDAHRPGDFDAEIRRFLREAHAIGRQDRVPMDPITPAGRALTRVKVIVGRRPRAKAPEAAAPTRSARRMPRATRARRATRAAPRA